MPPKEELSSLIAELELLLN